MRKLNPIKSGAKAAWSADTLRRWFSDPQIFAARRLLGDSTGSVAAALNGAALSVRVGTAGRTYFATVRMAGLDERARGVLGSCTCGTAGTCEHIVAGFLVHTAQLRSVPADVVLTEVIGSGTAPDIAAERPESDDTKKFTAVVGQWLKAAPNLEAARSSTTLEAALYLEGATATAYVLDRVGVEIKEGPRRSFASLSEAAGNTALPPAVQRGAALLLAAGASRSEEVWDSSASSACLDLARAGHLRLFGQSRPLVPSEPFAASLEWRVEGSSAKLLVHLPEATVHLVDAEPGLYITASGQIGELSGVPVRVLNWAREAPPVPLSSLASFNAALEAHAASRYLPAPPRLEVERAVGNRIVPTIALKGQGSTARVELSFDYGAGLEVSEPGGAEVRKFVDDKWIAARRDMALEKACIARLQKGGVLKQTDFRRWSFHIPALFAHVTRDQWLALQKGLVRDLEFEDWNVRIDEDFGFRPDVVARKDSAEAEQRVNRKRGAA